MKQAKDPIAELVKENLKLLAPPPKLSISEWADRYRVLSRESSAEPGRWKTSRIPYAKKIMDIVKDRQVEEVIIQSAAQVGKTEILLNIIGYYIHQDPSPMLAILPTLEMAESWSKDRLSPMIRDSKVLQNLVRDPKAKTSSNTIRHKNFLGGQITLAGANSPSGLSSRPIKIVLADEVDRFPSSAGSEGDPINLAKKRSSTFYNKKFIAVSTPVLKQTSRISRLISNSRRFKLFLICRYCQEEISLKWRFMGWENDNPETAYYSCNECGAKLSDGDKIKMLKDAKWKAFEQDSNRPKRRVGFFLSALNSPWVPFAEIVREYLEAKKNPELMKTWVNTYLGEPYEEETKGVEYSHLYMRRETYNAPLPEGVLCLTCGVDIQDDRIEAEVVGWGKDRQSWSIGYFIMQGDPASDLVWQDLDTLLDKKFKHEWGFNLKIAATAIDTGFLTKKVYDYCQRKVTKRVYAVKGVHGTGKPLVGTVSKKRSGRVQRKVALYPVGVDEAKTLIYTFLGMDEGDSGFCHFPMNNDYNQEYFRQLTAESVKIVQKNGYPEKKWVLDKHKRNEALDCRVYSLAALTILRPLMDVIERKLEDKKDLLTVGISSSEEEDFDNDVKNQNKSSANNSKKFNRKKPGISSYINSWRDSAW